jgi:hypothetical protein
MPRLFAGEPPYARSSRETVVDLAAAPWLDELDLASAAHALFDRREDLLKRAGADIAVHSHDTPGASNSSM